MPQPLVVKARRIGSQPAICPRIIVADKIIVRDPSKIFEGRKTSSAALDHVNLDLKDGEFPCIVLLIVIVSAEFVAAKSGIGYLIWTSWSMLLIENMFVGIIVITGRLHFPAEGTGARLRSVAT